MSNINKNLFYVGLCCINNSTAYMFDIFDSKTEKQVIEWLKNNRYMYRLIDLSVDDSNIFLIWKSLLLYSETEAMHTKLTWENNI